jgi:hypothetical protein
MPSSSPRPRASARIWATSLGRCSGGDRQTGTDKLGTDRQGWRSVQEGLGRYPPREISEWGALGDARAIGGNQSGTAILAVTVTGHRPPVPPSEPSAVKRRPKNHPRLTRPRRSMGDLPHRNTATSKLPKVCADSRSTRALFRRRLSGIGPRQTRLCETASK